MTRHCLRALGGACGVWLSAASPTGAQPEPQAPTEGVRVGAVLLRPELVVSNFGVDTNILRENDGGQRDVVGSVTGRLATVIGRGGLRLEGRSALGWDYFRDQSNLRAANHDHQLRLVVAGRRAAMRVDTGWLDTRERYNYEIEARVRRSARRSAAGLDLTVTPRSSIGVLAERVDTDFDGTTVLAETPLADALRQRRARAAATYRYALTPLTAIAVTMRGERIAFERGTARDARRLHTTIGLDLKRDALVSGSLAAGYQWLVPQSTVLIPHAQGLVAAGDLAVRLDERTHLLLAIDRDIEYSYQAELPLYRYLVARLGLQQRLGERWRVGAGVARQVLDYTLVATPRSPAPAPIDRGRTWSADLAYRATRHVTVTLEAQHMQRRSPDARRQFRAVQVLASLRVGLH